ncbi:SDR family NAD(P)-dependent oxidoreductase [Acetobacter estunensis]|uniref:SDR family NAD(P)-dependent oxidoreductase n=1 Tax=Acetobacter estunensis TaxID=104097 RepID=UPI001C2D7C43|nr:SDR family oxidoreductase [Acetobacter estunensis]MBV1838515.1 SDR family oxidoreductase [Acetobacter estunensis]
MDNTRRPIAIVTGASRGLGRSTALALARNGVDIIGTYRSRKTDADTVAEEIWRCGRKAVMLPLDTGKIKTFSAFRDRIQDTLRTHWQREHFNYLVNNAGIGIHAPFATTTEADFDELVNVHFKGVFFLTQNLLPLLKDGGRIVNVSSGLTRFSLAGYSAYAAMKGAIEVLTRYLAKELGANGITVNTIAPGAIETDFGGGAVRDNKEINNLIASVTALGRAGMPDDIGPAVAAILSEDNHWMTGQRVEVSGGMFV